MLSNLLIHKDDIETSHSFISFSTYDSFAYQNFTQFIKYIYDTILNANTYTQGMTGNV